MKLAIIIPTYNEKENITLLVRNIFGVVKDVHVVVVDDNSPDGTAKMVRKLARASRRVHLVVREHDRGRGSAVIAGFAYARDMLKADTFVEMDADCSHDPEELPDLLAQHSPRTLVVGSRYVVGSEIRHWSMLRKITSRIANTLIRFILGVPLADNTNGYRCYSREAVDILLRHKFVSHGYILLSESSYVLMKHGFHFTEIPTIFTNRVKGKSNATFKEFYMSLVNVFRMKLAVDKQYV